ncbi:GNAT family N-acetyltransferase [Ornithinibacillus sp. L9]|uniref:GNAT family N-acetyltransferase n=1 Tax=Ornithinibacillus caprae TaxID=2678566 RepID=A0A6N8FJQ2_9BACI|nr:GNAT family N-acetyltransferase [Ornithinibacillus caprae]MUK87989.1 GNAT family N-acetyltransferase [Ornithinibacillus caprae]
MINVTLVPHNVKYAECMSALSSETSVKEALGLTNEQTSIEGTKDFITFILEEEKQEKQFSRVILNEENKLIGVITLKDIDHNYKTCHIGTWIGQSYWGKGYNELAKRYILHTAFMKLQMEYVFAGAKIKNIRSQKSQERLPYVTIGVEEEFPNELEKLEEQVGEPCILNVIKKSSFMEWYSTTSS